MVRCLSVFALLIAGLLAACSDDARAPTSVVTVSATPAVTTTPTATSTSTPTPNATPTPTPTPTTTSTPAPSATATSATTVEPTPSPTPRATPDTGWTIETYDTAIAIAADGSIVVTETIAVDFGTLERHGVFRKIPLRSEYGPDPSKHRRVAIDVIGADDGSGHAWPFATAIEKDTLEIRAGDPEAFVTGKQTFRITYTVIGALDAYPDRDELAWTVIGAGWSVPIGAATAIVSLSTAAFAAASCRAGAPGYTVECKTATIEGAGASFAAGTPLAAGDRLTVVVSWTKGAVSVVAPVLE